MCTPQNHMNIFLGMFVKQIYEELHPFAHKRNEEEHTLRFFFPGYVYASEKGGTCVTIKGF